MEKVKELLKKVGFSEKQVNKYFADDADFDAEKEAVLLRGALETNIKHDLEPDWDEQREKITREVQGEAFDRISRKIGKHFSIPREIVDTKDFDKIADHIKTNYSGDEKIQAEFERVKKEYESANTEIEEMRESLKKANETVDLTKSEKDQFISDFHRDQKIIKSISEHKTKITPEEVYTLAKGKLFEKGIVKEHEGKLTFFSKDKPDRPLYKQGSKTELEDFSENLEKIIEPYLEKSTKSENGSVQIDLNGQGGLDKKISPDYAKELAKWGN